jgi:quercetin dioxygenase-like cupin family protein
VTASYTLVQDLGALVEVPAGGIISRTIFKDERLKAVLFGFAEGQELSEHTASVPAVLHILEGRARLTLGADTVDAAAGTWVHMPARIPHSLVAVTAVRMVLLLLQAEAP